MRKSGIYKITINGKNYIGSATDLRQRKNRHLHDLRKNKHCNLKIQRIFNKYTEDKFVFKIIELVSPAELILREQYYIDTVKPELNICLKAGNSLGTKHSEETKKRLSKINKGNKYCLGRKLTDYTKNKISLKAKSRKLHPNFIAASIKANKGSKHSKDLVLRTSLKTAKLSLEQVCKIRELLKQGNLRQKDIAKIYGVCQRTICNIKNNKGIVYPSFKDPIYFEKACERIDTELKQLTLF